MPYPPDGARAILKPSWRWLIGERLTSISEPGVASIAGIGIALDLTLRDLQQQLKKSGHPWEKAKAFDGSCPVSGFVRFDGDLQNLAVRLCKNGTVQQDGNTGDMITPVLQLLAYASRHFSLMPGDILLTGTPAGVGELEPGDKLTAELGGVITVATAVIACR